MLTDKVPELAGKFFAALWGDNEENIAAWNPKAKQQTERYNKNLVTGFRNYLDEHQNNWEEKVRSLTYD